jgi:hypothetical protein
MLMPNFALFEAKQITVYVVSTPQKIYQNKELNKVTWLTTPLVLYIIALISITEMLLHLPPLRFHCVGGCWDRTQDSCDYGIGCQTLYPLG